MLQTTPRFELTQTGKNYLLILMAIGLVTFYLVF